MFARLFIFCAFIGVGIFAIDDCVPVANPTVSGIFDQSVWFDIISVHVSDVAGQRSFAKLDGLDFPVGLNQTLTEVGTHKLNVTTITSDCEHTSSAIYRFIILDSSRGQTEWGLQKWTPPTPQFVAYSSIAAISEVEFQCPLLWPRSDPIPISVRLVSKQTGKDIWENVRMTIYLIEGKEKVPVEVSLRRGRGVVSLPTASHPDQDVTAFILNDQLQCSILHRYATIGAESLKSDPWGPSVAIQVPQTIVIERGSVVLILSGTVLLMAPGTSFVIRGNLKIVGAGNAPVVIKCAEEGKRWGGILVDGGSLDASRVIMVGSGGNDLKFGHHELQPMVFAQSEANVTLNRVMMFDGVGPAIAAHASTVTLDHVHVTGFVAGTEFMNSHVVIENSHFGQFPLNQTVYEDTDSDAFYGFGGQISIRDSVFRDATDDGIDCGSGPGGKVEISRCLVENCWHEGIALSNLEQIAKTAHIADTTITGCQQGLEMGFSTAAFTALAERVHIYKNQIGVRYADNYGWETQGTLQVLNSVVRENGKNVWNFHRVTWEPVPERLYVTDQNFDCEDP